MNEQTSCPLVRAGKALIDQGLNPQLEKGIHDSVRKGPEENTKDNEISTLAKGRSGKK